MKPRLLAALFAVLVCAGPALAQNDDVLGYVPDDALGFVLVNRIGHADEQFTKLAKAMNAPMPDTALASFKKFFHIDKSLDDKGAGLAVLFLNVANAKNPVEAVLVVPVTNYQQFLQETKAVKGADGLSEFQAADGKTMVVAHAGKFAVLVAKDQQAALEKVLQAKKGTSAAVKGLRKELAKNDMSTVITGKGIKELAKAWEQAAQAWKVFIDPTKPEQMPVLEMIDGMSKFVSNAEKSVTRLVAGVRFDDTGDLHATFRAPFRKGSVFAKMAGDYKTPPGGLLADLPGGAPVAVYGVVIPKTARAAYLKFMKDFMTAMPGLPPGQGPEMIEALEALMNFDSMVAVLYPRTKDAPILGANMISVIRTPNAQSYLTNYNKALQFFLKNAKPAAGGPPLKVRQVKVGDLHVLEYTSGAGGNDPLAQKLLGPGGSLTASLAAVDEHTVVSTYVPAKQLPKVLNQMKAKTSKLIDQADVKQITSKISAESQYLLLLSPYRAAAYAKQVADQMPNGPKLPSFPKTPMVGFGIHVAPEGTRADLVVPSAALEHAPAYFEKLKQLQAPGAGASQR